MKKWIAFIVGMLTLPGLALTVSVDGEKLPADPAPIMSQGRVLVPLRQVFQALEAEVDYKNGTVTAKRGDNTVRLKPFQKQAEVNGKSVTLDAPAQVVDGRTFVPLRFVAQALGEPVQWQSTTRTVLIGEGTVAAAPSPQLPARLKQLVVGNQGGVLKVKSLGGSDVVYYRGLDDRSTAPLSSEDQDQILQSLGMENPVAIADAVEQVIGAYQSLPQKEAIAFLGVMNSLPAERLETARQQRIQSFLSRVMQQDSSVYNRRQAVLALAVGSQVNAETAQAVLDFYSGSENLWETFPVQQFFEYQAERLSQLPNYPTVKSGALAVNSLYRDSIAQYLGN